LKNRGYNFEHNFGHGHSTLSSVLATLLLLSFLTHTASRLADPLVIELSGKFERDSVRVHDMSVLTKYGVFTSFEKLFTFMSKALDNPIPIEEMHFYLGRPP
jgi:hypothetical protein